VPPVYADVPPVPPVYADVPSSNPSPNDVSLIVLFLCVVFV